MATRDPEIVESGVESVEIVQECTADIVFGRPGTYVDGVWTPTEEEACTEVVTVFDAQKFILREIVGSRRPGTLTSQGWFARDEDEDDDEEEPELCEEVNTTRISMGPEYDVPSGCFGGYFTNLFKSWFGDSAFREYESNEAQRYAEYRREMSIKRDVPDKMTELEMVAGSVDENHVSHVPRVVVSVVCQMRMKLGLGAMDRSVSGNVALVRAEAARVMRGMNMRHVDAAAHLDMVEECFFGENTHLNATRWRLRVAQSNVLQRWLFSKKPNPYGFDC